MKKYTIYTICLLLIAMPFLKARAQSQLRTPYPIIFVHGLGGSYSTWDDPEYYDLIDFFAEDGLALTKQKVRVSLDNSPTSLTNTLIEDVFCFPLPNAIATDLYIINFNIHRSGNDVVTCIGGPISFTITPLSNVINVSDPYLYNINDILNIGNEFMRVEQINGFNITVERGILGTLPAFHLGGGSLVYNHSNQGNQADIAKQGYGLKLAIDKIKLQTGSDTVILVGHSMGGLACREYIRSYYNNDVAKIITIGSPHYGTGLNIYGFLAPIIKLDASSSAMRDLRAGDAVYDGVFLFGGRENLIPGHYYSSDINCDGDDNDYIQGLNQNYSHLADISRTWIVSTKDCGVSSFLIPGEDDGVVSISSQYISPQDTIMTHTAHLSVLGTPSETKDIFALIRGLDEPHEKEFAYKVKNSSTTKGFITYQKDKNSYDIDLFKIQISTRSELSTKLLASSSTGIDHVALLNEDLSYIQSSTNITNIPMLQILEEGTYYIRVSGVATDNSYNYPYTLTTDATIIPPNSLVSAPEENLEFYDVVVNDYRDKTITLTNNSLVNISVTNLELAGLNPDQFNITSPTSFDVPPSGSSVVTVRCSPTVIGENTANLIINNSSTDAPIITISLHGIGVASETRRLITLPDVTYNYGNVNTTQNKTKIFKLKNTGSDPISVTGLSLNGTNADNYSFISQPEIPFEIETGIEKQLTIKFSPTSIGVKTTDFIITNNSDNASPEHIITLYGNGENSIYNGDYNTIVAYEYWFDNNYSSKVYTPVNPQQVSLLNSSIPTEGLIDGLHRLNFRSKDSRGFWSAVVSEVFYKLPITPSGTRKITAYEYWFDNDYTTKIVTDVLPQQTITLNGIIDGTSISTGLHSFHTRFKDDAGQWSAVVSEVFYKLPIMPSGTRKITEYEYWFDNDYTTKIVTDVVPQQSIMLNGIIDGTSVSDGLHSFHTRFKDDAGQWSAVVSEVFYKLPIMPSGTRKITEYEYWFDNDYASRIVTDVVPQQTLMLNGIIDGTSVPDGLHSFQTRFKDDAGQWSAIVSEVFYKLKPIGSQPNLITDYRYWFDLDYSNVIFTTLPAPANPYHLINNVNTCLLPQGEHTIHFQFKDTRGAWSSVLTDTFDIAPMSNPVITANGSPSFCEGNFITLTSTPADFYLWNTGATTRSIDVSTAGNYSVTVDYGCGFLYTSNTISTVVETFPSSWTINPTAFQYICQINARVKDLNGNFVTSGTLAVFVNDVCRGLINATAVPGVGHIFPLKSYSNSVSGEILTFKYFNPSSCDVCSFVNTFNFVSNHVYGNVNNPEIFLCSPPEVTVNKPLFQGNTYFSLNITNTDMSINNVLSSLTPVDLDNIKNQTSAATYYSSIGSWWSANLTNINPASMYHIKLASADQLTFTGTPVNVATSPLQLNAGWNWIAYFPQTAMPINEAFAGLNCTNGDNIKNNYSFATFYSGGTGWYGNLTTLEPLEGYKLKIANAQSFTYPVGKHQNSTAEPQKIAAFENKSGFFTNPYFYSFSGALNATVYNGETLINTQDGVLLAFVGDECRGAAFPLMFNPTGTYTYQLMVYSNVFEGEILEFKFYDELSSVLSECIETIEFSADMLIADAFVPLKLHLKTLTANEEIIKSKHSLHLQPNPFKDMTTVSFFVAGQVDVRIEVTDVFGRLVAVLTDQTYNPGQYAIEWQRDNVSAGTYFVKMVTGKNEMLIKKAVIFK
ncbi:MAG: esterase/lipase/thioesterase [Bacteroidetes bacterium]|nr:MAG: esterase/lipase/thioesterase [Bacteroidota bacterium]